MVAPPRTRVARDRAQLIGSLGAEQVVLPAEIRSALDDVSAAD